MAERDSSAPTSARKRSLEAAVDDRHSRFQSGYPSPEASEETSRGRRSNKVFLEDSVVDLPDVGVHFQGGNSDGEFLDPSLEPFESGTEGLESRGRKGASDHGDRERQHCDRGRNPDGGHWAEHRGLSVISGGSFHS